MYVVYINFGEQLYNIIYLIVCALFQMKSSRCIGMAIMEALADKAQHKQGEHIPQHY